MSIAAAVALLWWGLPKVAGVSWSEILRPLTTLHPAQLALMAGLQLLALVFFTFTITGSLPGIRHGQALTVNLGGSLVANTLPFGGALALGATYAMCRSWGFSRSAIGISIVLGGIFSSVGKVLLPVVGLIALVAQGGTVSPALRNTALVGVLLLAAVVAAFVWAIVSPRAAVHIGRVAETVASWFLRLIRRPRELRWDESVRRLRATTRDVMRSGWFPMLAGVLGYIVVYFVLFWVCMHSVGLVVGIGTLLAAYALGRLLTSVAVTPGGLGLVEAGSVALMVAMGADPAQATAGVLLFTIFTHVLEIPFGVLAFLYWGLTRNNPSQQTAPRAQQGSVSNTPA